MLAGVAAAFGNVGDGAVGLEAGGDSLEGMPPVGTAAAITKWENVMEVNCVTHQR